MNMADAVTNLLSTCYYVEDIKAIKHFVFHPRMNGCSNMCILCHRGIDICADDLELEEGHTKTCPYLLAIQRIQNSNNGSLKEYMDRK